MRLAWLIGALLALGAVAGCSGGDQVTSDDQKALRDSFSKEKADEAIRKANAKEFEEYQKREEAYRKAGNSGQ